MMGSSDNLDAFLRAVHRRAAMWRVVESTGIGLAIGAAAGAALVGVMLLQQSDGRALAAGALAVGALAGLIRGVARWPSLLEAAGEADRQLNLHDLLGTALAMRSSTDEWAQLVVVQADRRARQLRPRDVLLQRFGVRVWGSIGIATAMVGVLASLSAQPSGALATNPQPRGAGGPSQVRSTSPAETASVVARRSPRQTEATSDDGSFIPAPASSTAGKTSSERNGTSTSEDATSTGGGSARTPDVGSAPMNAWSGRSTRNNDTAGQIGSGDGNSANIVDVASNRTTGRVSGGTSPDQTRVTGSESPSPVRNGIPMSIDAIPDAYRDVARFYFDAGAR